ncbi:Tetratricopeptide repeat protein 14 [Podila verticillata]|nr:Tetratricopeptide repeat protein 14 [Podila verticillata]
MQQQQQQPSQSLQSSHGPALTNIDSVLEGTINKFVRSEKYARKIKYIVRGTSVPGRQSYKFAPATALTPQETRIWRQNLIQDEIASNNPFWTTRWMAVFGVAPKLDDSLLKVPWIKCERTKAQEGDTRAALPLHRKETYLDLRDEQNRNWAMDSHAMGIQCAQNGQLENALKAYSQAIQIDSKNVDAYIARGCTLANTNKYKEAIMDFRQALTLQPSNDQARRYLESTVAQEEHVRLNPQDQSLSNQTHPSRQPSAGAYYQSNLDDINEIVLDTEEMHVHEDDHNRNDEDKSKKKKKKKSKKKRGRDNIDRSRSPNRGRRGGSFYMPEKRLSTRDSKNENGTKDAKDLKDAKDSKEFKDAKDAKDAKDTKDANGPKDAKENKSSKDGQTSTSKGSEEASSSSKKVEITSDTVYFMRANIDAQKDFKTDAKDGKDIINTKNATKDVKETKETKGKDDKDVFSKRPMEETRRDDDSKRHRTRSPEHHRRPSPHHRDRPRSRSRSETGDAKSGSQRRRPLPSQSDLRRAQASGSNEGGGGKNRNRGRRN